MRQILQIKFQPLRNRNNLRELKISKNPFNKEYLVI